MQEELVLDEQVFTLGSPILNPPNLTGKVTARTVLQAMILESDDTAADMALQHVGPERVRELIASLGLGQTRIPDSTRQYVGYLFGDPDWRNLTWAKLLPLVNDTPYPPRLALNDEITMASSADDLVSFYARALPGEIFRYPETLAVFRTTLSLKDEIAQAFPLGVNTFVKGEPRCVLGPRPLGRRRDVRGPALGLLRGDPQLDRCRGGHRRVDRTGLRVRGAGGLHHDPRPPQRLERRSLGLSHPSTATAYRCHPEERSISSFRRSFLTTREILRLRARNDTVDVSRHLE